MVKKTTTIPMLLDIILKRIERLERYTRDLSFEDYSSDEIIRDACERNIEVIGEIAKDLFKKATGWKLARVQRQLEKLLGKKVDVAIDRSLHEIFRPYIEKDLKEI